MISKMSEQELEAAGYHYHHAASCRGYTCVGDRGMVEPYNGPFGRGYKRFIGPYRGSKQYQAIQYWVE